MAEGLSELADTEDPHVGDLQQSVPPTAGGDAAELAGGDSTEPGDIHAGGYGDRRASSLRDCRDIPAQAEAAAYIGLDVVWIGP